MSEDLDVIIVAQGIGTSLLKTLMGVSSARATLWVQWSLAEVVTRILASVSAREMWQESEIVTSVCPNILDSRSLIRMAASHATVTQVALTITSAT
jgi:hypothetical protein